MGWLVWSNFQKQNVIFGESLLKSKLKQERSILMYNMMEQMSSTAMPIGINSFLADEEKKEKLFSQLNSGPLLALRVSHLSCSMCVDSSMVSLNKFVKKNSFKNRVIILTSYTTERDLILFRRLHQINDIEIYNINEDEIILDVLQNKINLPYGLCCFGNLLRFTILAQEPEKECLKT